MTMHANTFVVSSAREYFKNVDERTYFRGVPEGGGVG